MKKYAKLIQADKRGQIVIPKEVRQELAIDEETGFFVYTIPGQGIFLKQLNPQLADDDLAELKEHAQKLGVDPKALKQTIMDYTKNTKGGFEQL